LTSPQASQTEEESVSKTTDISLETTLNMIFDALLGILSMCYFIHVFYIAGR